MMNAPFESVRNTDLRNHYEQVTADWFLSIGRRKYLISAFVLGAIVLAAFLVSMLPQTYTAEALIYPDISQREDEKVSVLASLTGIAFVSSEAELLKSKAIAADVVNRLGLDTNPAFISASSASDTLRKLRSIIKPETAPDNQLAIAVERLQSRLEVHNDNNTYVITVRYSAASPDLAATIANAILFAYERSKHKDRKAREVRMAHEELGKLAAVYGKRHPSFLQADAKLSKAIRELQIAVVVPSDSNADRKASASMVLADPSTTSSNSTGPAVIGGASILGLFTGFCVGMWLDRRDNGFKTSDDVAAYTSARCVGLLPAIPSSKGPNSVTKLSRVREALRAIAVEAGLEGSADSKKVALVTAIGSSAGALHITEALGRVLVTAGQRVLLVDAATIPASSADHKSEELVSLDDVLANEDFAHAFFETNQDKRMVVIKRAGKSKIGDDRFAICSRSLSRFFAAARKHYDVVLIASSLTLHPVDTALIGRDSDVKLLVARWNSTRRHAVNSAIKRLSDFGVQVNGVVLSDVKVTQHHRRGALKRILKLA